MKNILLSRKWRSLCREIPPTRRRQQQHGGALCVCDSFDLFSLSLFFFLAERWGRCIDRNGGLRQRQPSYRSRRQRSARLPSSGINNKSEFSKMKPLKMNSHFPSGDGGGQQVNHPQACYAKICRSDIDCLGGKTVERVCCYNGYLITTRSNIKRQYILMMSLDIN